MDWSRTKASRSDTVVCVDDEENVLASIRRLLDDEPYDLITTRDPVLALELMHDRDVSLIIADQRMKPLEGTEILGIVRDRSPRTARVILTAYAEVEPLTGAMEDGRIQEVLRKPWENERLRSRIREILGGREDFRADGSPDGALVGCSPAIAELRRVIRRVAPTDATVLIAGETGTGKELVARAIHDQSPRRGEPFVAINCGGLPETLLASELFGHVRGAFTGADHDRRGWFEAAGRGTILLDEVGELPPALQAAFLRALETREVLPVGSRRPVRIEARMLAATNANLAERMRQHRFRPDLYYRLDVVQIRTQPLRERPEDIPPIVEHLLRRSLNRPAATADPRAIEILVRHAWPGNVRELANVLERSLILGRSDRIGVADLPPALATGGAPDGDGLRGALAGFEHAHLRRVLAECDGDKPRAARRLGISLASLYRKLRGPI